MEIRFRLRRILALLSLTCLSLGMVAATAAAPSGPSGGDTTCEGEIMDVVAEGVGTTSKDALSDALRSAVAQVVGLLVVASDQVKNDALIESKVLTYSDGYVKSHVVITPPASRGGLMRLKIQASVCVSKLTKALTSNAIRVRKLDLQSIQGESETLDTRSRSAAEIAAEAFKGFPSSLLKAEPLKERRVSGDSDESIVEIPVRVEVDMTRWKTWFQQAKRLLDRIAESKGTENWNTKTPGWHPLRASTAKPRSGSGGGVDPGVEQAIYQISHDYWTCRFIPDADRRGASVFLTKDRRSDGLPLILTQKKRVVAILDSMGGRLHWWQLSQDAFDVMIRCIHPPTLTVRIDDPDGNAIGSAVTDWSEIVESDTPGQDDVRVIGPEHKLGLPKLLVGRPKEGVGFQCAMPSERGEGVLLFPSGLMNAREGEWVYGTWTPVCYGDIFTPVVVFPYRFRVPADELPQATAAAVKVTLGPFGADDAGNPPPTAPSGDSGPD